MLHGILTDSQTFDEGVHLVSGISYWQTGDFRLNPEHPVLWKLVAALPVLVLRPQVDLSQPSWAAYQEWDFASSFFEDNQARLQALLIAGRLATLLASVALVVVTFLVGRKLFSPSVGFIAAGLMAFDPTVIAHGRFITTDTAVTLAILTTLLQLIRYHEHPTRGRWWLLTLAAFLTISVKFSGLIIFAIIGAVHWYRRRSTPALPTTRRLLLQIGLVCFVGIFFLYGARLQPMASDPRIAELRALRQDIITTNTLSAQPDLIQRVVRSTEPGQPLDRAIRAVEKVPLPFYWYIRGTAAVTSHAYWGQHAYLLGQTNERGWWWYFPATIAVKFPAPTFSLLMGALVLAVWWRFVWHRRPTSRDWYVLIPLVIYGGISLFSRLNLGIRHLLPLFPFLFILAARIWLQSWPGYNRLRQGIPGLAIVALAIGTLQTHPRELASFSWFVGGAKQGHRFVMDSNLDWGQDLFRLKKYLESQAVDERVALAYSGTARPQYYGLRTEPLPTNNDPAQKKFTGIAAISLGNLIGQPEHYGWVRNYPLVDRVGASILIYRIQ